MKKLKSNLKFGTEQRLLGLADVCDKLGFDEEAKVYRGLIEAAKNSRARSRSRSPANPGRASAITRSPARRNQEEKKQVTGLAALRR